MVKSSSKRITKYDTKRTITMPVAFEAMVKNRRPDLESLGARAEIDEKVAGILTKNNISGSDRIKYHNFGRYIEKRVREKTLTQSVVESAKAKYVALGCDEAVLDEIIATLTGASA